MLIAQAINFLIIFFVLRKFAFGPIMQILRKRREEIEQGIRMKNEAQENLRKIDVLREETLQSAREQAVGIVDAAQETAKVRREEILQEAARKSEAVVGEAKRAIREEKAKMTEEFVGNAEDLVRMGIVKVIGRLPAEERDGELIKDALRELKSAQ